MMKTPRRLCTPLIPLLTVAVITLSMAPTKAQDAPHPQHWVGTWATAQVALLAPESSSATDQQGQPARINNQTVRQVVRVSIGGSRVRVAVANTFGTEPLQVGAAEVALSEGDGRIDASSATVLTFGGHGAATTIQSWLYLARVDVLAAPRTNGVVAFGDSITEGYGSTPDTNHRWPDLLARRLHDRFGDESPAVMNMGISGNRVLSHNGGPTPSAVA